MNGTVADRFAVIRKHIQDKAVLDLGCVDSRRDRMDSAARIEHKVSMLHKRIVEVTPQTIGVDIDPDGVAVLNAQGYHTIVADAQTMDLGKQFDTIVAGEIIEHLENPGLFLENLAKHLRDGGNLVISTPNPFYAGASWKIWRYGRPEVHEEHTLWLDPMTLRQLLLRTGFEVVEAYWVQPKYGFLKRLKLWKCLFRGYFSESFMMVARKNCGRDTVS